MPDQLTADAVVSKPFQQQAPGPNLLNSYKAIYQLSQAAIPCFNHLHNTYGNLVRLDLGFRQIFISQDAEQVSHVFKQNADNYVKLPQLEQQTKRLFGEGWTEPINRTMISPFFKPKVYLKMFADAQSVIQPMLKRWEGYADSQQPFDVAQEMMDLSLALTTHVLIGHDFNQDSEDVPGAMMAIIDHWNRRSLSIVNVPETIPTPKNRKYLTAASAVQQSIDRLIERRQQSTSTVDLLSVLQNNSALSAQRVRERLLWIVLPAFEPIGRSLAWMWYLLSRHADAAHRVQDEVAENLTGENLEVSQLQKLSYCKDVIQETLRLYPPFWLTGREAIHDDTIGGFPIAAGSTVLANIFGIHHHPAYWQRPEAFDPDRFSSANAARRSSDAFIPFSTGPRACLGYQLSIVVMQLVLSTVMRSFRLNLVPEQSIEPVAMMTLLPRHGIWVTASKHS